MKRSAAVLVCLAHLLALPQASWRHVHAHGHDEHHARDGVTFHAHVAPVGGVPAWRAHGPDEDARALGTPLAAPRAANPAGVAILSASLGLPAPTSQLAALPAPVSRGHDPPPTCRSGPRAPPA